MPSPQQILDGLGIIANDWKGLAIGWHVVFGTAAIALALGWRPGKRLAGLWLAVPLVSVSVLAWLTENPFNGTVFAVLAAALAGLARPLPRAPVRIGEPWAVIAGIAQAGELNNSSRRCGGIRVCPVCAGTPFPTKAGDSRRSRDSTRRGPVAWLLL